MIRKILLAATVTSALFSVTAPASAATYVRIAPPAPQVEVAPAARHGYVWAPGYWDYRHRGYVWVGGSYVRARPGYVYAGPQWREHGGRWTMEQGRWARGDRDHDGVPNRFDRRPNDPYRR